MPHIFKTESAKATLPRSPLAGLPKPATWGRPDSAATGTQKPKFLKEKSRKKLEKTLPKSGEGGIRTPDAGVTDVTVFETAAFNHSATSPRESVPSVLTPFNRP